MPLPKDGTYPGSLLAVLQDGLKLDRSDRIGLEKLQTVLQSVKRDIDQLDYIIIPAHLSNKKSDFSSVTWDTTPTDSERLSPVQRNVKLQAIIHRDSSTESEKDSSKSNSPVYESVQQKSFATSEHAQKCYVSDDEERPILKFELLPEKEYSSACSTPIAKIRARMKDIVTYVDDQNQKPEVSNGRSTQNENATQTNSFSETCTKEHSPESADTDSFTGLKRVDHPEDRSPETDNRERTNSWCYKSPQNTKSKYKIEEDILASMNIKPLVAIHEKWIFEANRKTGRSMSLPENTRDPIAALKPASHCVDTLKNSLPQLNSKRHGSKYFKPSSPDNDAQWTQFCQARDNIAKKMNFAARDPDRFHTWRKDTDKGTTTTEEFRRSEPMVDQATDTQGIENFIRDLIRKELQHIFLEMQDDISTASNKTDEILDKGVANIIEHLKNNEESESTRREPVKSFSRVKINGNNKPLLQITFSRSGENSLQVLDKCVNVTICDSPGKGNQSVDEDGQVNGLKRCQAFNALQEARSTEDLYIDDELSTQLHDNFGKMRLIPLHGSLHEILCEKADDCCLIKVKQENGCDTIYFRCDNEESRDAIDGLESPQDTVVFKRSISLIEERIQRIFPGEKRATPKCKENKTRPKSEVLFQNIKEKRFLSNSSPSLPVKDDAVELNIENVLAYDSSSDECLKCQTDTDDFEYIERKIEEDLANSNISNLSSLTCGCLEKISEENLSALNEDTTEKESSPDPVTD